MHKIEKIINFRLRTGMSMQMTVQDKFSAIFSTTISMMWYRCRHLFLLLCTMYYYYLLHYDSWNLS